MKKILVIVIAAFMLCSTALCEEIDLSSMNLEDLLALHTRIDEAINEELTCLLDTDNIYQGVYVVGKDIAPGYYLFTCIIDEQDDGNFDFFYELYDSEETYAAHNRSMFDRFNCGTSAQLNLQDGMVLRIINGTAKVQAAETPAWAP